MVSSWDYAIGACGISSVVAVMVMFGLPKAVWFIWHPILMTMGFAAMMSIGRRVYHIDMSDMAKPARRRLHAALMVCAAFSVLVGYVCIFMAHLPMEQFFGYDFKKKEWKPWERVVHVYMGYASVALVLFQVIVGGMKYQWLQVGHYTYRFHGDVGRITHVMGIATICMGVIIMASWSIIARVIICLIVASTLLIFGVAKQFPADASGSTKFQEVHNDEEVKTMVGKRGSSEDSL